MYAPDFVPLFDAAIRLSSSSLLVTSHRTKCARSCPNSFLIGQIVHGIDEINVVFLDFPFIL